MEYTLDCSQTLSSYFPLLVPVCISEILRNVVPLVKSLWYCGFAEVRGVQESRQVVCSSCYFFRMLSPPTHILRSVAALGKSGRHRGKKLSGNSPWCILFCVLPDIFWHFVENFRWWPEINWRFMYGSRNFCKSRKWVSWSSQDNEKPLGRSNDSSLGSFFHHFMTSNHVGEKIVQQNG